MLIVSRPLTKRFDSRASLAMGSLGDDIRPPLVLLFALAVSLRAAHFAAVVSSTKVTFTAMSGRMRGSFCFRPMRTLTVALSRLAVGTIAMTAPATVQSG